MDNKQLDRILSNYRTPLYVFDIKVLKDRISYLRSSLPESVALCYAIKANTFIVGEICDCTDCLEVCSPGELSICLKLNIPAEKIVLSGVYKTPELMEQLIKDGVSIRRYTVESVLQLEQLKTYARRYDRKIDILLRLTSGNQFGINGDDIIKIISENADNPHICIKGIQYFSGTQKTSLKRHKKELERLDAFLHSLTDDYGFKVQELEYGPGFPVSYFQSDSFDETEYLKEFSALLNSLTYDTKIILELGRSIAASCGSYLTRVVDAKTNKDQSYAIVDGGMNHLVYFGQSMAMKQPFYELYPRRDGGECKSWNLCGSLCTTNDILVKQLPLQELTIGDTVVFKNTGAYCMTEGISLFLSRDLPGVILSGENGELISVREPVDTYKLNLSNYERN